METAISFCLFMTAGSLFPRLSSCLLPEPIAKCRRSPLEFYSQNQPPGFCLMSSVSNSYWKMSFSMSTSDAPQEAESNKHKKTASTFRSRPFLKGSEILTPTQSPDLVRTFLPQSHSSLCTKTPEDALALCLPKVTAKPTPIATD